MTINIESLELGKILGSSINNVFNYNDGFVETEETTNLDLYMSNNVDVHACILVSKSTLSSTSFVLDHPVYSDLDSSVLLLNGIYASANDRYYVYCQEWDHFTDSRYIDGGTTATIDTTNKRVIF
ncbi:MAG TPA: hypothetical protein V6C58_09355 [Allocoleopsis sp.]